MGARLPRLAALAEPAEPEPAVLEGGAVSIAEFLAMDLPDPEPILTAHGAAILHAHQIALIFAEAGVGKTNLGLAIAHAASAAKSVLGWVADRRVSTLYVDGEMYHKALRDRNAEGLRGMGVTETPRLSVLCKSLLYRNHNHGIPDLAESEGQRFIEERLGDAELLILDNISSLVHSGAENEAESWRPIQEWLIRLRSRGLCVVLIHHAGKNGEQRGTSKRRDVIDLELKLTRPGDYVATDGCRFKLEFTKARMNLGPAAEALDVALMPCNGGVAFAYKAATLALYERVVAAYREGTTRVVDLAEELEANKGSVSRALKKAKAKGAI